MFSAMLSAEIARHIHHPKGFRHSSEASKFFTQFMSRLHKTGRISKQIYKYYINSLAPKSSNFLGRWALRLQRYQEIVAVSNDVANKSDLEKIKLALEALADKHDMIAKTSISDTEKFADTEAHKVANNGFIALTKSQEKKHLQGEDNLVLLSCYTPTKESGLRMLRILQTYGFSLYEPETHFQPKQVGQIALIVEKREVAGKKAA